MAEISFEIVEHIGTLSEGSWNLELNKVSWNGKEPKYDLRSWDPEHKKCGKGITLNEFEIEKLKEILN